MATATPWHVARSLSRSSRVGRRTGRATFQCIKGTELENSSRRKVEQAGVASSGCRLRRQQAVAKKLSRNPKILRRRRSDTLTQMAPGQAQLGQLIGARNRERGNQEGFVSRSMVRTVLGHESESCDFQTVASRFGIRNKINSHKVCPTQTAVNLRQIVIVEVGDARRHCCCSRAAFNVWYPGIFGNICWLKAFQDRVLVLKGCYIRFKTLIL